MHQGVALRVRPYEYAHPDDFTQQLTAAPPLIVALDGVTDPRNLGAVVRSAAAFGATGVVVPARRSAGVTAGAWKASAGAIARLPVARATNLTRTLEAYKERGLFVAGLDAAGTTDVGDMTIADGPMVLVVGSEGRGLSRVVAGACDMLVRIPMSESTESLNAGVARVHRPLRDSQGARPSTVDRSQRPPRCSYAFCARRGWRGRYWRCGRGAD